MYNVFSWFAIFLKHMLSSFSSTVLLFSGELPTQRTCGLHYNYVYTVYVHIHNSASVL